MAGLPGGCNPADVLYKLAHGRGIKAPEFVQLSEEGPPHAKTFTWHCSFLEVKKGKRWVVYTFSWSNFFLFRSALSQSQLK